MFQLFFALDIPTRVEVIEPIGNREPDTKPIGHLALRLSFDWRSYL